MSTELDVYRDWLGITTEPRPPDHYTLLGVPCGETDIDLINAGANARLKIVRPRCLKYPEQGTQLLNEIAQARICLTDEEERTAYDRDLQGTSTQDLRQWARIHATFTDLEVFNSNAVEDTPAASVPETEPDTYRLASPAPESDHRAC